MRKTGEYETPEIEVTRFELTRGIMEGPGVGEAITDENGDIVDIGGNTESNPDDGGDLPFPMD